MDTEGGKRAVSDGDIRTSTDSGELLRLKLNEAEQLARNVNQLQQQLLSEVNNEQDSMESAELYRKYEQLFHQINQEIEKLLNAIVSV